MSSEYTDIIGDDQVFYSPSATDALVNDANLMYTDFMYWLDECETADAVFDSVISPYFKGNPPADKRMKKKRPEYDSEVQTAKQVFDDSLEEIINYIIDYSSNLVLTLPEETAENNSALEIGTRFEIEDITVLDETVVVGEIGVDEDSEVSE